MVVNPLSEQPTNQLSPTITQQLNMLNIRINDMMTQLNVTMKAIIDENASLKIENKNMKLKTPT